MKNNILSSCELSGLDDISVKNIFGQRAFSLNKLREKYNNQDICVPNFAAVPISLSALFNKETQFSEMDYDTFAIWLGEQEVIESILKYFPLIIEQLSLKYSKEEVQEIMNSYKQYLFNAGTSDAPVGPSKKADIGWHAHILHMEKYMWDCTVALGKILWHSPFRPQWSPEKIVSSDCSNVDCSSVDCSNADRRFHAEISGDNLVLTIKKASFNISDPKLSDVEKAVAFA
jgi:hypothetical protein